MTGLVPIRRALLSVSDKQDLLGFATALTSRSVELLASGGTRSTLVDGGVAVIEVAEYTGQPEILGGRVKTLHPKIHAGILARRAVPEDMDALQSAGFLPIDLVFVNLYPFEATIARPDCTFAEAIEQIDIGGPSLIRAAAKNFEDVAIVTSRSQIPDVLAEILELGGTTLETRRRLAAAAFNLTTSYDRAIADYFDRPADPSTYPKRFAPAFVLERTLRYGENPHQSAAFYRDPDSPGPDLGTARVIHGKELSFNNLLDLDSALRVVRLFEPPAAVVLKHNNPCGAAVGDDPASAFERAYEGDPVSAFGGIVGLNRPVDAEAASRMAEPGRFLECILAPEFMPEALTILTTRPTWKNSVRLVALNAPLGPGSPSPVGFDFRRIEGGLLVQGWDAVGLDPLRDDCPTNRKPTEAERADLDFAWRVVSAVKSNAIVLVKARQLVGVGAGQMSRLDSVRIAVEKAGDRAEGAVMASDAFFPFRDGPDIAAKAGVTAIVQPGGSKRDAETLAACDEAGIAMVLTGRRHFRH